MAAGPNRNDTMKNVMAMDTQNLNPSSSSDAMEIESFLLSDCCAPVPSDSSSDSKIVKQITHHKAGLVRILKLHGDSKLGLFYYATDAVHVTAPQYHYATTFSEKFEFNSNKEAAIFLSNYFKLREQEGYEYRYDQDPPPLFYKILSMRPDDCSSTATTLSADPGPSVAAATANYEANLSDQGASPNSNYDDEGELDMAATNSSQAANRKYKRRREFDLAEQRKLIKTMPLEQLKEWYHLRRDEAAVKLGICETAVTKIYNKYYPDGRWPYRKVNSLIKEMRKLRKLKTNPGERSVDEIVREMDKTKQMLDAIYETDSLEKKDMGSVQTVVCVKRVKQDEPQDWDESMPLPGDIIEGFAQYDADELFQAVKAKSELSSQLGKISQKVETIWVKVRRGDGTHKLRVRVVVEKSSMLHKKYTIRAARDDRHVAVLGDLTIEQCTTLQEMSRRVVNVDYRGFNKKEMKYDWKKKLATYLPDQGSTVISSILFLPFQDEYYIEPTISRCMAWFTAAVSSGVPLVFVNIQTEQIVTSKLTNLTGKERSRGKQQNNTRTVELVQGIRLWFLPGVEEVSLEMIPQPGESRFGMDIKRTDEEFICVYSVTKGSAADRAGLQQLLEEASAKSHLLIISRLQGKSLMPSSVSSAGFIHCCDHNEIKDTLTSAINQMDIIQLHIMAWPNQTRPNNTLKAIAAALLRPPDEY
ncbi:Plant regulator RWP-RK [Corchorus capsularis]|uniref:Plant regulator RWP-RK n=1 Tax=Corchorus capsularis TaxID=210143 RepID=A0A1R3H9J6_COCAP|nr:Plant regulator RWP-RK [Corchorus capsularis]